MYDDTFSTDSTFSADYDDTLATESTYSAEPFDTISFDTYDNGVYEEWTPLPDDGCCTPPPDPCGSNWDAPSAPTVWDDLGGADIGASTAPVQSDPAAVIPLGQPGGPAAPVYSDPAAVIPMGQPGGPAAPATFTFGGGTHFEPSTMAMAGSYGTPMSAPSFTDARQPEVALSGHGAVFGPTVMQTAPAWWSGPADDNSAIHTLYAHALSTPSLIDHIQVLGMYTPLQPNPYRLAV